MRIKSTANKSNLGKVDCFLPPVLDVHIHMVVHFRERLSERALLHELVELVSEVAVALADDRVQQACCNLLPQLFGILQPGREAIILNINTLKPKT